ncbi:hypothetical protein [Pseudomonas panipatensis]|uniref:Uncharacterized protein n=1 Tax=Pseudomonas panipatensis TaxID=428992 RepID=A0A1G8LTF4_9PSED|nr:hypothetical protein [Pseudomonas panipatensis]SDI58915.1 hypothetical protein SAMN05216272_11278 [Pseudomonas panipatensis]SMP47014.1 hypothetical protein SAMN06295951_10278 [Pseudomonas panipatensis]
MNRQPTAVTTGCVQAAPKIFTVLVFYPHGNQVSCKTSYVAANDAAQAEQVWSAHYYHHAPASDVNGHSVYIASDAFAEPCLAPGALMEMMTACQFRAWEDQVRRGTETSADGVRRPAWRKVQAR